jgi:signal transduction histidine kinase
MFGRMSATIEPVFGELKRYVRFSEEEQALLRELSPHLRPRAEAIADAFYERLREHEAARRIFADDVQIERQKERLIEWMTLLVAGPWDEAYAAARFRIGKKHVEIGLPQRYMFGAMALIRDALADLARKVFAVDPTKRDAVVRAVHKLLDIELALMLESYAEAHILEVQRAERLEAALEKERLAERTRRAEGLASLGTMAAGLAHEVRNPLNAAKLQLQLLQRKLGRTTGPDLAGAKSAAELVSNELNRLAVLVDEVLQFARPQPLRRTRVDLCETARTIVTLTAPEAAQHGVRLELECGEHADAELDDERIKQVLLNLVRNAVDACEAKGGGSVILRVFARDGSNYIEVEDDGPGLPDPNAPIFEPFFTTKPNGTGLGLSLVNRIVCDHGGSIRCESRPGRTVFSVSIPLATAI